MTAVNVIAMVLASLGLLFFIVSFVGIVRFPGFYARLHAQGVGDTIGMLFMLLAMMVCVGLKVMTLKLLLIFVVTLFTNPLGTSILMQAMSHSTLFKPGSKHKSKESK